MANSVSSLRDIQTLPPPRPPRRQRTFWRNQPFASIRITATSGNLNRAALAAVDAHPGFPVRTIRLVRSGEGDHADMVAPSAAAAAAAPPPPPPPPPYAETSRSREASLHKEASCGGEISFQKEASHGGGPPSRKEALCGRGDHDDDGISPVWSIFSGGDEGIVAHWSVMGLASERERLRGAGESGINLCRIGSYEVTFRSYFLRVEGGGRLMPMRSPIDI